MEQFNCPKCGSPAIDVEHDGTFIGCRDCNAKPAVSGDENREYAIQYAHACGYRD